ncbi:MAG: thioredoxin family protein [Candidatus Nanopelagicaceae bacterium]|nr:thioredoxin family protein [Candidatus Nanopelagicaceae bacterium]
MDNYLPILIVFTLATAYGLWYQRSRGKLKNKSSRLGKPALTANEIGQELGSRVTLVQFSSAFCTPCRATRALLTDITADLDDVVHVDIDAEKNLDLVRRLDVRSTPTTLVLNGAGVEVGRAIGAPKRADVMATLNGIK